MLQPASTKHTCLPRRETSHSSCCKCTVPAAAADCGLDGLGDAVLEHYSVLVREAHWGTGARHPPTARAALSCHSISRRSRGAAVSFRCADADLSTIMRPKWIGAIINDGGKTALMGACEVGNLHSVKLLVQS